MQNINYIKNLNIIKKILDKSTYEEKTKIISMVVNKNIETLNKKSS